jgi:hypothetical protein
MTRPTLDEVLNYRAYVNEELSKFILEGISMEVEKLIEIGLQHEQQHHH